MIKMQNQHWELWLANNQQWQTVLYCTIGDDHRSRGQYDSLWSVLRPDQFDTMHSPLNVCRVCVMYEWRAAADTIVTVPVSLLGEPWLNVYSMQPGSQFLLA